MKKTILAASIFAFTIIGNADARDQIKIVGSSTVYPFATVVAERFGKTSGFKTPVIESTGSGGGLKLFCKGLGTEHPDITNASRRIKMKEVKKCANNGVTDITEIKVGFDGIAMANAKSGPKLELSLKDIYLALAKVVPADPEGPGAACVAPRSLVARGASRCGGRRDRRLRNEAGRRHDLDKAGVEGVARNGKRPRQRRGPSVVSCADVTRPQASPRNSTRRRNRSPKTRRTIRCRSSCRRRCPNCCRRRRRWSTPPTRPARCSAGW